MRLSTLHENIDNTESALDHFRGKPIDQALELVQQAGMAGAKNLVVPQFRQIAGNKVVLQNIEKAKVIWGHIRKKLRHHPQFDELDQAMQLLGKDQHRDADLYTD